MNKRLLQFVNVALAVWILFRALLTLVEGTESPLYGTAEVPNLPVLDSNLRFLGGIGVSMAFLLFWVTPSIGERAVVFRTVWSLRLGGSVGRLISLVVAGAPPMPVMVFTVSEVFIIPFLLYWQATTARQGAAGASRGSSA